MIYVVFVLVYMIGASGTCTRAIVGDAKLRARLEGPTVPLPPPPKFSSYLFGYGLLWPVTIWTVLYDIWQEYTGRKE